jgi:hypothetical protein
MTIDETFARICHETPPGRGEVHPHRTGAVGRNHHDLRLRRHARSQRGSVQWAEVYVDKSFDGIEVEYLEDRGGAHEAVKRLCVDLHIPCRAI